MPCKKRMPKGGPQRTVRKPYPTSKNKPGKKVKIAQR